MFEAENAPSLASASERAPGVASCRVCGKPLTGKQRVACSDRHRAEFSRRQQAMAGHLRDQEIREDVGEALRILSRVLMERLPLPEAHGR